MSYRFVDAEELQQVDLGDGDWVKIPAQLAYGLMEEIGALKNEREKNTALLMKVIKEWNLVDKQGTAVPITMDNIRRLDMKTVNIIGEHVAVLMGNEKKVSVG